MFRYALYILPILLLVGAGCVIGNSMDGREVPEGRMKGEATQEINLDTSIEPHGSREEDADMPSHDADMELIFAQESTEGEGADTLDVGVNGTFDAASEAVEPPVRIALRSGNFFFDPPLISAKVGQEIEIQVIENQGLHTFVLDEIGLRQQLKDGTNFRFTVPQKAGDYVFYCDIGEHKLLGMEGILRVTP